MQQIFTERYSTDDSAQSLHLSIVRKTSNFSREQLSEALFCVNAITSGVELTNSITYKMVAENREMAIALEQQAENQLLKESNQRLTEQVEELQEYASNLKDSIARMSNARKQGFESVRLKQLEKENQLLRHQLFRSQQAIPEATSGIACCERSKKHLS